MEEEEEGADLSLSWVAGLEAMVDQQADLDSNYVDAERVCHYLGVDVVSSTEGPWPKRCAWFLEIHRFPIVLSFHWLIQREYPDCRCYVAGLYLQQSPPDDGLDPLNGRDGVAVRGMTMMLLPKPGTEVTLPGLSSARRLTLHCC